MEGIFLLVLVGLPILAALKEINRRASWFSLAAISLALLFVSVSVSADLNKSGKNLVAGECSRIHQVECEVDPERHGDSCQEVPLAGESVLPKRDSYSSSLTGILASGFLGFLPAGLLYRSKPATGVQPRVGESPRLPTINIPVKLSIHRREIQGVTVLDLSGKLFLGEESFRFRQHLRELLDASKNRILLNLADVDRVDSAGIGILVEAVILTIKEGGELKLVNVPPLVHNVLVVHRLLSAFEIHSDEEEALTSFK